MNTFPLSVRICSGIPGRRSAEARPSQTACVRSRGINLGHTQNLDPSGPAHGCARRISSTRASVDAGI